MWIFKKSDGDKFVGVTHDNFPDSLGLSGAGIGENNSSQLNKTMILRSKVNKSFSD